MAPPPVGVSLPQHWRWLSAAAGWNESAPAVGDDLLRRYADPHRAYHNQLHLFECLEEWSAVHQQCEDALAVAIALWFHDAIHDATRSDNEAVSADLAAARLVNLGEPSHRIARIRELILDTAHGSEPATHNGRIIADIDLTILGKSRDRFDNYDSSIRLEYARVPDEQYRPARAAVLRKLLSRPVIYRTPSFVERYERQARENLNRAIARLEREPNDSPR